MSTHVLDHIIHLTPPGSVEHVSSEFRKLGFDVIPGGTHADGVTYNALVVLSDGVYLELIAFVHPDPPSSHRWSAAAPGWIDFANLGLAADIARTVNGRAAHDGSGAAYAQGVRGGRATPDGKTLEWRVTFPEAKHGVGRLPFFCEDLTPRALRVPPPGVHPSSARGISHVKVLAASGEEFAVLSAQLTTVLGVPPASTSSKSTTWSLDTPSPLPDLGTRLILEQVDGASQSGIHEVGFWVDNGRGGQADSPYGKIVWTPVSSVRNIRVMLI